MYDAGEAVALVKKNANAKFNETVEIHVRLGVDPKKSDQNVRGTVACRTARASTVRVIAFAKGDKLKEAEAAGADFVGENDLVEKVKGGFADFDVAVATPDMMATIGKELGRILAQKMPNPKSGTVTPNIGSAIRDIKAGKVEYRLDKTGIVHTLVGKANFDENAARREHRRAARRDRARQAVGRQGHLPALDHALEHDGSRRQDRPHAREGHRLNGLVFYEPGRSQHGLPFDPFKSCVVPRPIGWLSTLSVDGVANLAPFSRISIMPRSTRIRHGGL